MKKRTYRSKEVKQINWDELKKSLSGEKIAVAIDVAKQKQYAVLTNMDGSLSTLFRWQHPEQTLQMFEAIESLDCPITVILESTSTYGDIFRNPCCVGLMFIRQVPNGFTMRKKSTMVSLVYMMRKPPVLSRVFIWMD